MIDLTQEKPVSLAEAAGIFPRGRNGAKPHLSTLLRWIARGAKSLSGELVRLEAIRTGAKWATSVEAVQRFCERLTGNSTGTPAAGPRTSSARSRASARAARQLEAVGI